MNILVLGSNGTVGKHLKKYLDNDTNINVTYDNREYDLRNAFEINKLFSIEKFDLVINLAAIVGGIIDNMRNPDKFFLDNLKLSHNIMSALRLHKIEKYINILSTCIYPENLPEDKYPLNENMIYLGIPEKTNINYALAKRISGLMVDYENNIKGNNYINIIPANLYSEFDQLKHISKMHFIGSLLNKISKAQLNSVKEIELLGDGTPMRQFVYADDLARFIYHIITENKYINNINFADNNNMSIKDIANKILNVLDIKDINIVFNNDIRYNGIKRKDVNNSKLLKYFPDFKMTSYEDGIKLAYKKNIEY